MWMEKEHFADWMLTDQKAFAGYARLFMDSMDSTGAQLQGFLDWCWEKYLEGVQPSSISNGFGDGNSRFSKKRNPYARI